MVHPSNLLTDASENAPETFCRDFSRSSPGITSGVFQKFYLGLLQRFSSELFPLGYPKVEPGIFHGVSPAAQQQIIKIFSEIFCEGPHILANDPEISAGALSWISLARAPPGIPAIVFHELLLGFLQRFFRSIS